MILRLMIYIERKKIIMERQIRKVRLRTWSCLRRFLCAQFCLSYEQFMFFMIKINAKIFNANYFYMWIENKNHRMLRFAFFWYKMPFSTCLECFKFHFILFSFLHSRQFFFFDAVQKQRVLPLFESRSAIPNE